MNADEVVQAIDRGYENDKKEKARRYIGASIIGTPCEAVLAYNLRGFPNNPPDPRLKRIFNLGHMLEDVVVDDLKKKANLRVWEVDALTGKQHTYQAWGGHIVCHTDGMVEDEDETIRVLEIKSMNDASFSKFKKSGVKVSHPQYFGQCQMMMGMGEIETTLFVAINKNNCDYHAEIIEFDDFEYAHIQNRIERVVSGQARKVSTDGTDWRCKGCFKRGVCWGDKEVPKDCPTCAFSLPRPDGRWHCTKLDDEARDLCPKYEQFKPLSKE
jgi:rubrerythrin